MSDNEFDAIRRLRSDVPSVTGSALDGARAQLLDRIDEPVTVRRHTAHRRWMPAVAAAAAVAAVAVGAVVVEANHSSGSPTSEPPATQQHRPAAPAVAPFRLVTSHSWSLGEAVLGPRSVWYSSEGTTRTWVPADQSDTWYWRTSYATATHFLTADDADYVRANNPELTDPGTDATSGKDGIPADGATPPDCSAPANNDNCVLDNNWEYQLPSWIATLPSDAAALRTSVYAASQRLVDEAHQYAKTADVDTQSFDYLSRLLSVGYLPAALQSAIYQVLATIPGVTAVAHETALDGAEGVGLSHVNTLGDERSDVIFTAPGGTYLGARTTVVSNDWLAHHDSTGETPVPTTHVPVGTVVSDSSVSVHDTDSAP